MGERITNGNFSAGMTGWTQWTDCPDDWCYTFIDHEPWPDGPLALFLANYYTGNYLKVSQDVDFTNVSTLTVSIESWVDGEPTDPHWQKIFIDGTEIFDASAGYFPMTPLELDVSAFEGTHTLSFQVYSEWAGAWLAVQAVSAIGSDLPPAPVAAFTADPLSGSFILPVLFVDESTNSPTSWLWDFGDGHLSNEQNVIHEYTAAGVYSVTLTAYNDGGFGTLTKTDYITVTTPPIAFYPLWTVQIGLR